MFYKITKKSFTLPMHDEGKLKSAFNFDFMLRERERERDGGRDCLVGGCMGEWLTNVDNLSCRRLSYKK